MTEEIIIDGIDISECEFANACSEKMKCVILQDDVCEIKPYCEGYNCYYKQLQRLKQENKKLKEKLGKEEYNACCECTNIQNQNDNYRSALEEIREMLNKNCGIVSNAEAVGIINEVLG